MPVFGIFPVPQNDLDDADNIDLVTFIEDKKRKEMMREKNNRQTALTFGAAAL